MWHTWVLISPGRRLKFEINNSSSPLYLIHLNHLVLLLSVPHPLVYKCHKICWGHLTKVADIAALDVFNLYQAIHIRPISNPYPDDIHIQRHIGATPGHRTNCDLVVPACAPSQLLSRLLCCTTCARHPCPVLKPSKKSKNLIQT